MKNGFTLVELSIVLVIIGLLIGGILIGQSLVESSRVSATGKQLGEFDAAVASFMVKYKQIPGDSKFHVSTGGGDGDGNIESFATWGGGVFQNYTTGYQCEMSNFWVQALPDKFTSSGNCGAVAVLSVSGSVKTAPKPAIGKENTAFIASTLDPFPSSPENYYSITLIGAYTTTGGHYRLTPSAVGNKVLTPMELFTLDKKFDDGAANAGYIRSGMYFGGWGTPRLTATATCSNGASYYINTSTYECTPFFRMGMMNGNLK